MASGFGKIDSSAIVEMEVMDGDESDYEVNFSDTKQTEDSGPTQRSAQQEKGFMDDAKQQVAQNVTSYVFEAGRQRARQLCDVYGKIDILRPYFDVEPHEVRLRLFRSLIPSRPSQEQIKVPRELYGPSMLVLTLIALLLFQMKMSDHTVQEGTLMGSAFGTCFGYWFGVSGLTWTLAYVCNTHIAMLQIMSLVGYALFGHCVVLFLGTVLHTSHDHMFFYMLWGVLGGLSSLKMASVLMSRTAGQSQKVMICGVLVALHMLFLIYLHFSYHVVVEELSDIIEGPVEPQMLDEAARAVVTDKPVVDKIVGQVTNAAPGEGVQKVVRSATQAVQDIVHAANNNTNLKPPSKILNAIANKTLMLANNTNLAEVGKGMGTLLKNGLQQAVNATKLS